MEETSEIRAKGIASALLRAVQPAIPAVIGAAALTFLFAAVMPFSWVAAISWNLYLDRLSDLFVAPIGNGGRLALAFGMAAIAAVLAGLVALVIAKPEAAGLTSLRDRFRRAPGEASDDEPVLTRRRIDLHPDDPPRPPIRAGRDLPAGGLGPLVGDVVDQADTPPDMVDADELVLSDLAPAEEFDGEAPWLQPAEMTAPPPMPDPADKSLGAMVARFEAGLSRRRQDAVGKGANPLVPGAVTDDEPEVDFALEAALGTLQRMTRQSVG
ncbi:hypothetical protein [Sphingopyxis sp. RIFCSPHIGHO2_12_FULL_65_19]|uniref:hypothetical protein n=1 Tax=Sphingopyxis sp. RIFCSPHIGHO2_12_FULL_65_19 TaxID=1802172 RepID=UPI0008CD650C|nr:hypothetical protein [Sphingopyxis sp. RIFCSPHIGHO2_12_FULL_65_19]OHD10104.1 MAG: hypothetical protein A3E77_18725 [Sphingopyxis sp. RIFCSPHIGHO2_12_FULL_65_19]